MVVATQMHLVPPELFPIRAIRFAKACSGHWREGMMPRMKLTRSSMASSGRLESSMKLTPSVPIAVLALKVCNFARPDCGDQVQKVLSGEVLYF